MKFLFLIYHDETVMDALPEGEMQTLIDSALDYDEEIRQATISSRTRYRVLGQLGPSGSAVAR
jgi:hypothetical protein